MALIFADRVKETTTSTGTGPLTLAGAVAGFEPFSSVCADGDTAYYCVTDGTSWEVGLGTYAAGVLTRTSVLSSSNAGAAVALNPGSKEVHLDVPAQVIEADTALFADGLTISATPGVDGRLSVARDAFYNAQVWDSAGPEGPNWYSVYALGLAILTGTAPSFTGPPGGALGIANAAGDGLYYFDGASWTAVTAVDATARSSAASAASAAAAAQATANSAQSGVVELAALFPVFGSGTPAATSQPTDGSVINYFDSSTTPYTMWVWDGVWAQGGSAGIAFDADNAITWTSEGTSTPSTPSTGLLKQFVRSLGGRQLPAFVGPSGLNSVLQPGLMRNRVCWFSPMAGSATLTGTNGFLVAATGTATAKTPASTSLHTQTAGVDFLATTAATTAVAGFRSAVAQFWRGNSAGLGGFTYVCRFSPATGVATSSGTDRCWVGLVAATGAPTDVNPSTLTSMVGVGYDSTDANWQIMGNDGSGTAGKYDTGIAVPTTDRPSVFEIILFAPPNGSSIQATFTDVGSGSTFTQSITTSADLPPSTTFMCPKGYHSAGGTSTVTGMTLFSLYVETDL